MAALWGNPERNQLDSFGFWKLLHGGVELLRFVCSFMIALVSSCGHVRRTNLHAQVSDSCSNHVACTSNKGLSCG
jgi:hypothetical protein